MLVFRDGEHTGEAKLEEIQAGVDDGELSEECLIYSNQTNEWMTVEEFVRSSKKPRHEAPSKDVAPKDTKKAQRDESNWGKGSVAVAPAVPKEAPEDSAADLVNMEVDATEPVEKPKKAKNKFKHVKPPPKMMRLVINAIFQWDMIEDGDKLLFGLSGGKDSMSLLHCLLEFKRKFPIKFDIEVCTIDPMTPSFDPSPLIPYVESLGLTYHYIRDDIVDRAAKAGKDGKMVSSLCAFCARMKRGNLYACARRNGCNKLVLAQHLDDLAETFMMTTMHNGFLRTMKAHYKINAGDMSVIRPMVYCRESLMTEFAKAAKLPIINENCPACFEEPKERARIKKLLSREETLYPNFYDNIRRSLLPLMHEDSTAILRGYANEISAKSQKKFRNGKPIAEDSPTAVTEDTDTSNVVLTEASEEQLLMELARRKADRYRLAGAMKRLDEKKDDEEDLPDVAGQLCTIGGGCEMFD